MPTVCSVKNCFNITGESKGVSFFAFPKNIESIKEWITALDRPEWLSELKHNPHSFLHRKVCQFHFEESKIRRAKLSGRGLLIPGAVPSRLLKLEKRGTIMNNDLTKPACKLNLGTLVVSEGEAFHTYCKVDKSKSMDLSKENKRNEKHLESRSTDLPKENKKKKKLLKSIAICSAYNCYRTQNDTCVFSLPEDPVIRAKWVVATRRANWGCTEDNGLCARHFKVEDMQVGGIYSVTGRPRIYLRKNAIPVYFCFFKPDPKKPKKKSSRHCSHSWTCLELGYRSLEQTPLPELKYSFKRQLKVEGTSATMSLDWREKSDRSDNGFSESFSQPKKRKLSPGRKSETVKMGDRKRKITTVSKLSNDGNEIDAGDILEALVKRLMSAALRNQDMNKDGEHTANLQAPIDRSVKTRHRKRKKVKEKIPPPSTRNSVSSDVADVLESVVNEVVVGSHIEAPLNQSKTSEESFLSSSEELGTLSFKANSEMKAISSPEETRAGTPHAEVETDDEERGTEKTNAGTLTNEEESLIETGPFPPKALQDEASVEAAPNGKETEHSVALSQELRDKTPLNENFSLAKMSECQRDSRLKSMPSGDESGIMLLSDKDVQADADFDEQVQIDKLHNEKTIKFDAVSSNDRIEEDIGDILEDLVNRITSDALNNQNQDINTEGEHTACLQTTVNLSVEKTGSLNDDTVALDDNSKTGSTKEKSNETKSKSASNAENYSELRNKMKRKREKRRKLTLEEKVLRREIRKKAIERLVDIQQREEKEIFDSDVEVVSEDEDCDKAKNSLLEIKDQVETCNEASKPKPSVRRSELKPPLKHSEVKPPLKPSGVKPALRRGVKYLLRPSEVKPPVRDSEVKHPVRDSEVKPPLRVKPGLVFWNEPEEPPKSKYQMFLRLLLDSNYGIPRSFLMSNALVMWDSLSERLQMRYKPAVVKLQQEYLTEYNTFIKTLNKQEITEYETLTKYGVHLQDYFNSQQRADSSRSEENIPVPFRNEPKPPPKNAHSLFVSNFVKKNTHLEEDIRTFLAEATWIRLPPSWRKRYKLAFEKLKREFQLKYRKFLMNMSSTELDEYELFRKKSKLEPQDKSTVIET